MSVASSASTSLFASAVVIATPTSTWQNDTTDYLTTSSSSIIGCLSLMIAFIYLIALSWGYRVSRESPRPLNKAFGPQVQRYAPVVYVFLVLTSLVEISIASWLVIQYSSNNNYPQDTVHHGIVFLLFVAIWTFLTAGIYSLLFLHPTWSRLSISSIGAQGIWLFVTWLFWIVGAGVINGSLPEVIDQGNCENILNCVQLRLLFTVAVLESLLLTSSLASISWLAFQSTQS